jgi:hypothetical protein
MQRFAQFLLVGCFLVIPALAQRGGFHGGMGGFHGGVAGFHGGMGGFHGGGFVGPGDSITAGLGDSAATILGTALSSDLAIPTRHITARAGVTVTPTILITLIRIHMLIHTRITITGMFTADLTKSPVRKQMDNCSIRSSLPTRTTFGWRRIIGICRELLTSPHCKASRTKRRLIPSIAPSHSS